MLDTVSNNAWLLCFTAITWLVGGCIFGILPLGTRVRRTVGITWMGFASWRYIAHFIRNSEPFSSWVLTVLMPSTFLPGVLGCIVATTGGRFAGCAPCAKVTHELDSAERQLTISHRTLMNLLGRYSELLQLWKRIPDSVRAEYAGEHVDYNFEAVERSVGSCAVCFARPPTHAFVPCMHRCVCEACAIQLKTEECQVGSSSTCTCVICRSTCTDCVRVYDCC